MCVDEVNSASVKQDDVNGCLKFQRVIGGEQVVSSTPVSDVPETGNHAHVAGVAAAEFLQEYTGDMDEPFVEMSPTNTDADITVNFVGQTSGDHGKAVECLKYGMIIYGLTCVGSSPPTDYRRASEAVVIGSEPVQTDRPGGDSGRVNDVVPANTSMTPYIRSRQKRSGNRGSRKCR